MQRYHCINGSGCTLLNLSLLHCRDIFANKLGELLELRHNNLICSNTKQRIRLAQNNLCKKKRKREYGNKIF